MLTGDLIAYSGILIFTTLTPGPLMAVIVSKALGNDVSGAVSFGVGIAICDVLIIILICAGLGLWMQSMPVLFTFAKYVTMVYLLWVAYKMWFSSAKVQVKVDTGFSGRIFTIIAGIFTCIISPQTIGLYLLILPLVIDIKIAGPMSIIILATITFVSLALCFTIILSMAGQFRNLMCSTDRSRLINRTLAVAITASGCWLLSL